jgi:hypothetical protein
MTLNERLQEAFDKRVCGTAMLPASDLLSAMTAIEQAEAENAALKEQITNAKYNYLGAMGDCKQYEETIAQQAEAIEKLRDHIELSLEFCDEEGFCVRDNLENALAIQPSPEILQTRDDRVAAACAEMLRNKELPFEIDAWVEATKRDVSSMTALALAALVDSGEWRKYL